MVTDGHSGSLAAVGAPPGAGEVAITVERLCKSFGSVQVLRDLSLKLLVGERVLLRGENGSGKTLLINILSGCDEPDSGVIRVKLNGKQHAFQFPLAWRKHVNPFDCFTPERLSWVGVGRTWQDIRLFPTQSLRDNLMVATPNQTGESPLGSVLQRSVVRQEEDDGRRSADELLRHLGMDGRQDSSADRVSLGQAKRTAIARAFRAGAKVLFLDEPLAGLDSQGVSDVVGMLQELSEKHTLTMVIVEHMFNITKVLDLVTSVWTLDEGQLRVQTPEDVRAELEAAGATTIHTLIADLAGSDAPTQRENLPGGATLTRIPVRVANAGTQTALEVEDLVVYRGQRLVIGREREDGVIEGMSFHLSLGETAVLQAVNAYGKTTLFEAIAGLIRIERGKIWMHGKPIHALSSWARARLGLSMLQSRDRFFSSLGVREALHLAGVRSLPASTQYLLDKQMGELSGGERQKIALACALRDGASVVLLDEPFSAQDHDGINGVLDDIRTRPDVTYLVAVPYH